jgi:hypothetical protein
MFCPPRHASSLGAALLDKSVITRVVTVAAGRFAPGHLGELTQQVPFEMVDAVLEQTCRVSLPCWPLADPAPATGLPMRWP